MFETNTVSQDKNAIKMIQNIVEAFHCNENFLKVVKVIENSIKMIQTSWIGRWNAMKTTFLKYHETC